jgi:hypothetical protein
MGKFKFRSVCCVCRVLADSSHQTSSGQSANDLEICHAAPDTRSMHTDELSAIIQKFCDALAVLSALNCMLCQTVMGC